MTKPQVALITSPFGPEGSVSLRSADAVERALKDAGLDVTTFAISEPLEIDEVIARIPGNAIVFPVANGFVGESGVLQTALEFRGIRFIGSGAAASARCWDKSIANSTVSSGLTGSGPFGSSHPGGRLACIVPWWTTVSKGTSAAGLDAILDAPSLQHCDTVVIKPQQEGSSNGVRFVAGLQLKNLTAQEVVLAINGPGAVRDARKDALRDAVAQAMFEHGDLIVQNAVKGIEVTAAVLDERSAPRALPLVEIVLPNAGFFDFAAKYTPGASAHIVPARLPADIAAELQAWAVRIHGQLNCRHWSRSDFVVAQHDLIWTAAYLETNTVPGLTSESLYPDASKAAGLSMSAFVSQLVQLASI